MTVENVEVSDVGVKTLGDTKTVYVQFREPPELVYGGCSLWSPVKQERKIRVTGLMVRAFLDSEGNGVIGELKVCFDPRDWDTNGQRKDTMEQPDGLIYTDPEFEEEVNELLSAMGLLDSSTEQQAVGSEQGMQGTEYVSLDIPDSVTQRFIAWAEE